MSEFESSPRHSKRRRTGTYSSRRTTLSTPAESSLPDSDRKTPSPEPTIDGGSHEDAETRAEENGEPHSGAEVDPKTRGGRSLGRRAGTSRKIQHDPDIDEPSAPSAHKDHTKQTPSNNTTTDNNSELQTRSSGRARRPPKRFLPEVDITAASSTTHKPPVKEPISKAPPKRPERGISKITVESPQPKGILTPSRKERGAGIRKSVVFDADDKHIEEQLGFKDIDVSAKKTRTKTASTQRRVPSKAPVDVDDEVEVCTDEEPQNDHDSIINDTPDLGDVHSLAADSTGLVRNNFFTDDAVDDEPMAKIKLQVLERLTSSGLTPITHLEKEYNTLHSLLTATISAGESNSLLLLGSRGSGKSLLVEHALHDLEQQFRGDFHVVRLNGFVQTDDKLALREIWRQLGREMAVSEDETGQVSSYADTMASLLTLLSHAEDLDDPDAMAVDGADDTVGKTAKSVIFVMDEFDLFTTHPRQTLLYNLFDIAQARKAPIAVVGCSTRTDVVDLLEKRVKSRFSHRWLHVPAIKTLAGFEEALATCICLPVDGKEAINVSGNDLDSRQRWNHFIKSHFIPSSMVQSLLKKTFYSTRCLPDLLSQLHVALATLQLPREEDGPRDNLDMSHDKLLSTPPSVLGLLPQLPVLHLSLLIAAARLETIYDLTNVSFTLAHSHYRELLARFKLQRSASAALVSGGGFSGAGLRSWSTDTARGAWEDLALWQIIMPTSGVGGNSGSKLLDDGLAGEAATSKLFRLDVTLDELAWSMKQKLGTAGVGDVLRKWCQEI